LEIPNLYARDTYGFDRLPTQDQVLRCTKAFLIIAGSDGLTEEEFAYGLGIARSFGLPEAQISELVNFDYRHTRLDEVLKDDIRPSARAFLYDAIRVASADGAYSDTERTRLAAAADALGIDRRTRLSIEALVATEDAHRKLRASLLFLSRN
jgi:tellurite resistance protein